MLRSENRALANLKGSQSIDESHWDDYSSNGGDSEYRSDSESEWDRETRLLEAYLKLQGGQRLSGQTLSAPVEKVKVSPSLVEKEPEAPSNITATNVSKGDLAEKTSNLKFWQFSLHPLSYKEERKVISSQRFFNWKLPYGDYDVLPVRADIKGFQWKYWISRFARQLIAVVQIQPSRIFIEDLLWLKRIIFKYLKGVRSDLTDLQRKLLNSVYYNLRKCKTD